MHSFGSSITSYAKAVDDIFLFMIHTTNLNWDRQNSSHPKLKDYLLLCSWGEAMVLNKIFKLIIENDSLDTCCEITVRWKPHNCLWRVNIATGHGRFLLKLGNKPVLEAKLTQIYIATWCH